MGISSCLLGERVRYDGGHKRAGAITRSLGARVEWVAVCPELEVGMGVPREPVRLARPGPRMVGVESGRDWTRRMRSFARRRVRELQSLGLSGYIFKARSPSCGIGRVRLFGPRGRPSLRGRGLFAAALMEAWPDLPVADEEGLAGREAREAFLARVLDYSRGCSVVSSGTGSR